MSTPAADLASMPSCENIVPLYIHIPIVALFLGSSLFFYGWYSWYDREYPLCVEHANVSPDHHYGARVIARPAMVRVVTALLVAQGFIAFMFTGKYEHCPSAADRDHSNPVRDYVQLLIYLCPLASINAFYMFEFMKHRRRVWKWIRDDPVSAMWTVWKKQNFNWHYNQSDVIGFNKVCPDKIPTETDLILQRPPETWVNGTGALSDLIMIFRNNPRTIDRERLLDEGSSDLVCAIRELQKHNFTT